MEFLYNPWIPRGDDKMGHLSLIHIQMCIRDSSSSVQSQLKAAGYTLEKYERIYRQAFYDAAKEADPNWEIGKPIKDGA